MKTRIESLLLGTAIAGATVLLMSGCNKAQESKAEATMNKAETAVVTAGNTAGAAIDDGMLSTRVKAALMADADIKSLDIKVDTSKGAVQLSGLVDTQTQADRAMTVAKAVTDVKSVDNKIGLKTAAPTAGGKLDDTVVTAQVKAALLGDANVKSLDIGVVTRQGDVQLSGFVDSKDQMDRAVVVASNVSGVTHVQNGMSLKK